MQADRHARGQANTNRKAYGTQLALSHVVALADGVHVGGRGGAPRAGEQVFPLALPEAAVALELDVVQRRGDVRLPADRGDAGGDTSSGPEVLLGPGVAEGLGGDRDGFSGREDAPNIHVYR